MSNLSLEKKYLRRYGIDSHNEILADISFLHVHIPSPATQPPCSCPRPAALPSCAFRQPFCRHKNAKCCDKIKLLMKIYLDVCCLNRPFDDQIQDRVRLESESVLTILNHSKAKGWRLLNSEVISIEISKIPDNDKRRKVTLLSTMLQSHIIVDDDIEKRATELENLTFKPFDALHVACAEKGRAGILLTTDDAFMRKASQCKDTIRVRIENPVRWLMEVIEE